MNQELIDSVVREQIRALSAYHVQPASGLIKLDAMENPFDFPPHLREGLANALSRAALNRYPDPAAATLRESIRTAMRVPAGLDILLGNGSDEIIQMIVMAAAKPGATLLSVEPAFVMFKMIATFCGLNYVGISLREDFSLDPAAMLSAISTRRPELTFIAYPNNPTGNLFDRETIHEVIRAAEKVDGLVVIDEAYFAFADDSMLSCILEHDNAVLMRTVSKLGLAGLRLGMLCGRPEWLSQFDKVRLPYNINALTQAAAQFALAHYDEFLSQANLLRAERGRVAAALGGDERYRVFPSQANFLLVRAADSARSFAALRAAKIIVKHTHGAHPLLTQTLRLTIGTPAENDAMLSVLTAS